MSTRRDFIHACSAARLRWYAHAPALLRCRPTDRYAMRACPGQVVRAIDFGTEVLMFAAEAEVHRAARRRGCGGMLSAPALLRCRPTDRYAMRACPGQ